MRRGLRSKMKIYDDYAGEEFHKMEKAGEIEYKMTKEMADAYLKSRTGKEANEKAQDYLCKIVDQEFGLLGKCTRVLFF